MIMQPRYTKRDDGIIVMRGLVIKNLTKKESELLDELFGTAVGDDGLIGTRDVECRLSDGYAEHYLYITNRQE